MINTTPITNEHPDVVLLVKNTGASTGLRGVASYGYQNAYEGYYLRTPRRRYWSSEDIDDLKAAFAKTNLESKEYEFVFQDTTDYELEYDGELAWPAHFSFIARKKN